MAAGCGSSTSESEPMVHCHSSSEPRSLGDEDVAGGGTGGGIWASGWNTGGRRRAIVGPGRCGGGGGRGMVGVLETGGGG